MKLKEVLVIGDGIAGCAAALALAKKGIVVTIVSAPSETSLANGPYIAYERFTNLIQELQSATPDYSSCSRAYEQLTTLGGRSVEELLASQESLDRYGNIDVSRCLHEQLKLFPQVEWMSQHTVIELLTLEHHSHKKSDRYKKPACMGCIVYDHDTQKIDYLLAKETILATGGASSLYPYSIHSSRSCGTGMAMAKRAGARLLNMEHMQFHPLGLFQRDKPCLSLPLELWKIEGGEIHRTKTAVLKSDFFSPADLSREFYNEMLKYHCEHLWLDLTSLEQVELRDD